MGQAIFPFSTFLTLLSCAVYLFPLISYTPKNYLWKESSRKFSEKKIETTFPYWLIRYLKMSDHKNWRFRPLTLIKYLFAINFVWFFSIRMTLTNFVTNIEQNKNLFLKLWHHDFHSKITLKIFEVCCNSLIDDNMWCSIKNLCPAEVPSSSSCLLWGPKNLHNIFPEKSSAIFESIKL